MKTWLTMILMLAVLSGCGAEAGNEALAQSPEEVDDGAIAGGVKDASISGAGGNVAVDAGFAGDGSFIQIPAGFSSAQCKFTAAAATIDGNAISTQVSINRETGEVICEKVVQPRVEIPPEVQGCTASYTIVCVK
ncbi:MAG TPA: hypothetical protein VLJ37_01095 [bacterium]|nr:hypothetical protein [bacterium]